MIRRISESGQVTPLVEPVHETVRSPAKFHPNEHLLYS